jgi:hypothetical protein
MPVRPRRTWDLHQWLLPGLLAAALAVGGWVIQAAASSHYDRLTAEDGQRIARESQEYSDKQTNTIRQDLRQIRQDISKLYDLQQQVLLAIRERE